MQYYLNYQLNKYLKLNRIFLQIRIISWFDLPSSFLHFPENMGKYLLKEQSSCSVISRFSVWIQLNLIITPFFVYVYVGS